MKLLDEPLPGLKLLEQFRFDDARGSFVKFFHHEQFAELGIAFTPREEFLSVSHRGVLRGLHFQVPPADHDKLVSCPQGRVLDVVVDLRKDSPTFRQFHAGELSAANNRALFIPSGFAHGFVALEDASLVLYSVSSVHAPALDSGIHWQSIGLDWPIAEPIVSARDSAFVRLADFASPF